MRNRRLQSLWPVLSSGPWEQMTQLPVAKLPVWEWGQYQFRALTILSSLCSPPGPPASFSSRHVPAVAPHGSLPTCPTSPKLRRGCSPSIHQCR